MEVEDFKMKSLNSSVKDWMKVFISEVTVTDVTPHGCRVKSIDTERSHRGKIYSPIHDYWTNVIIKFHEEDMRDYMNRKQLTLPVPDTFIDMCNQGYPESIVHMWKCIIGGALRKAGFYEESQRVPEKDMTLF